MKRLNNKGFTLIELLAVIVILAIVMGIAATSVLSSMNKARGGSIIDSAMVVANGMNQKYLEAQVDGSTTVSGMTFDESVVYYLPVSVREEYGLKQADYDFASSATKLAIATNKNTAVGNNVDLESGSKGQPSFVYFDLSTGKFTVCLVAKKGGSVYVDSFKGKSETLVTNVSGTYNLVSASSDAMIGCSNGSKTW